MDDAVNSHLDKLSCEYYQQLLKNMSDEELATWIVNATNEIKTLSLPPDQQWFLTLNRQDIELAEAEIKRRKTKHFFQSYPSITKEVIADIKAKTDILDILDSYNIEVTSSGSSYKVTCPFHQDSTPSLTIWLNPGRYRCFGCGAHGDVYTFLQEYRKMTFIEAVDFLAVRLGITIEIKKPEQKEEKRLEDYPLTETGQAESLALLYGDQMRFDQTSRKWHYWNGVYWKEDRRGFTRRKVILAARARFASAKNFDDKDERLALAKFATRCEDANKIDHVIEIAGDIEPFSTGHEEFNLNPNLFACPNGVVNLKEGLLEKGRQSDMIGLSSNVPYRAGETCDRWLLFLEEIFLGNYDLINFIQRAVGYTMTGHSSEQCFFLCHGTGSNGKSVFFDIMEQLFGEYAGVMSFNSLLEGNRRSNEHSDDIATVSHARFVSVIEVSESKRLDEGRVKSLTGGDTVTARAIFGHTFTFKPQFKLWTAFNHKPVIRSTDEGIWRRVRLIPFDAYFPKSKADDKLISKLCLELPGILLWSVEGAVKWYEQGLGEPEIVLQATKEYRSESDVFADFLEDCTIQGEGYEVKAHEIYDVYQKWREQNGEKDISGTAFGRKMNDRGFKKVREIRGRKYMGIGLLSI